MAACLERLLAGGLEQHLCDGLCSHMRATTPAPPADLPPAFAQQWAMQALQETRVMLEAVFMLFYDRGAGSPLNGCTSARFAQLAAAFEAGALSRMPPSSAELGAAYSGRAPRDAQPALIGRHYITERDSAPVQYNGIV